MNLVYYPTARGDRNPLKPQAADDATVAAAMSARKAAAESELATRQDELAQACAEAARDELITGSGQDHTGAIARAVQRITELEGLIEFYDQALSVLEA
jgi:hypothetical protein